MLRKNVARLLRIAGIKDVWSQTFGQTKNKNKFNIVINVNQILFRMKRFEK